MSKIIFVKLTSCCPCFPCCQFASFQLVFSCLSATCPGTRILTQYNVSHLFFILSQTNLSVPTCPFQALFLHSIVSNFQCNLCSFSSQMYFPFYRPWIRRFQTCLTKEVPHPLIPELYQEWPAPSMLLPLLTKIAHSYSQYIFFLI